MRDARTDWGNAGAAVRTFLVCALLALGAFHAGKAAAEDLPPRFDNAAQEKRYYDLATQLRCLVCQNQSLAESQADLAQDLRDQVAAQIRAGRSDREIIDYLVARYGDFILYRPPLETRTWLLWFGPFLVLGIALFLLARFTRGKLRHASPLSEAEQARVAQLMQDRHRDPS